MKLICDVGPERVLWRGRWVEVHLLPEAVQRVVLFDEELSSAECGRVLPRLRLVAARAPELPSGVSETQAKAA